ncbi:hypothetical protein [Dictyobacter formicarum]|uniref:Conjugal transfer protein n=1 Tax=Dictyobacter formicarum TaxID=2778368 RepID=A0ABQ3VIJ7_9CHLR|nr:hypothetical protein [Dictyobacter formicarum]GHO85648.1 hypothetical protein KSZ_36540 [Dictyobacter formicarum]
MFIIGGLIAVAIVALLLAFFLARGDSSERRKPELPNNQAQTELMAAQTAGSPSATAPTAEMTPVMERKPAMANNQGSYADRTEETTGFSRSGVSLAPHYYDEDTSIQSLNRQVYELAGQLRALQRQSQEIERSLVELSGVIERMDERGRHDASYYRPVTYGPDEVHKD